MMLAHAGVLAQSGGAAPFSYADIPNQLLRINSLEGSLGFSGGTLTSVTDVSTVAGTVTVTGSPTYTAADSGLNNAPSWTPSTGNHVVSPNIVRDDMIFVAMVVYRIDTAAGYLWRDSNGGSANRAFFNGTTLVASGLTFTAPGEPVVGRKRVLIGMPGDAFFNGASIGSPGSITATGNGITWGNSTGSAPMRTAFVMACSAVPSAPLRAALEAKLITDFG